jgi:uncharacterized membrane protein YdbT with pleckstrin-like domain
MSIITNNLLPDETVIYRTRKHVIIFLRPMTFLFAAIAIRFISFSTLPFFNALGRVDFPFKTALTNGLFAFGALLLFFTWLQFVTSEYVITDRRLIMKEGFFSRRLSETRLNAVSHITVTQTISAQLFNYGTIMINSFGGTGDQFDFIQGPSAFQKYVHSQLDSARPR